MNAKPFRLSFGPALTLVVLTLAGCADQPGEITRDTEPFDGIAETATISAVGNEPFWGVTVEPAQDGFQATYSAPDNIDGTTFAVTRFAGNNGLGFSGEFDGSSVSVALTPGECSDSMADRSYPYTATVRLGERTLFGCAYTSDEPFTGDENP